VSDRPPIDPESKVLPEAAARSLLARASELEAARQSGSAVADLRAAAEAAGISPQSFDAALAELQAAERAPVQDAIPPAFRRRQRRRVELATIGIVAGLGLLVVSRLFPASASASVEDRIVLRCLTPQAAAKLVQPVLQDPASTLVIGAGQASNVLTIRATPEDLQRVQALLAEQDLSGSTACTVPPASR
jgi:hypothetical protein